MKHILTSFTLILILFSLVLTTSFAQSEEDEDNPNPTNESTAESLTEQITDLKEKIASRVAELNLVEKRGIIGTVNSVDGTEITLEDVYGNVRSVDVDEITNFESDADDTFGISDIEEGMEISVLGLYNKQSERILARFITVVTIPQFVQGTVQSVDEDEFTVTVLTDEDESYVVDVETSTVSQELIDDEFETSGFSDIEPTQRIFISGLSEDDPNRLSASRMLLFPIQSPDSEEETNE